MTARETACRAVLIQNDYRPASADLEARLAVRKGRAA